MSQNEVGIEEFEVVGLDVAKQRTVYVIFTYIYKDGEEEELSVIKIVRNKKEFKTGYKNCWCFCRTAYGRNN